MTLYEMIQGYHYPISRKVTAQIKRKILIISVLCDIFNDLKLALYFGSFLPYCEVIL